MSSGWTDYLTAGYWKASLGNKAKTSTTHIFQGLCPFQVAMLFLFIHFVRVFPFARVDNHQEESLSEKISAAAMQHRKTLQLQISADPLQLQVIILLLPSPAFFLLQFLLFPPDAQGCVSHAISLLAQTCPRN